MCSCLCACVCMSVCMDMHVCLPTFTVQPVSNQIPEEAAANLLGLLLGKPGSWGYTNLNYMFGPLSASLCPRKVLNTGLSTQLTRQQGPSCVYEAAETAGTTCLGSQITVFRSHMPAPASALTQQAHCPAAPDPSHQGWGQPLVWSVVCVCMRTHTRDTCPHRVTRTDSSQWQGRGGGEELCSYFCTLHTETRSGRQT